MSFIWLEAMHAKPRSDFSAFKMVMCSFLQIIPGYERCNEIITNGDYLL